MFLHDTQNQLLADIVEKDVVKNFAIFTGKKLCRTDAYPRTS